MGVEIHRGTISATMAQKSLQWGDDIGREIVNAAKIECPVDEGPLRSSLAHVVIPQARGVHTVVGSELPYAGFVHRGTGIYGPHATPIVPVTAKALKFRASMKGAAKRPSKDKRPWVFAKSVKGMKGVPYLTRGIERVLGPLVTRNTD